MNHAMTYDRASRASHIADIPEEPVDGFAVRYYVLDVDYRIRLVMYVYHVHSPFTDHNGHRVSPLMDEWVVYHEGRNVGVEEAFRMTGRSPGWDKTRTFLRGCLNGSITASQTIYGTWMDAACAARALMIQREQSLQSQLHDVQTSLMSLNLDLEMCRNLK